MRFLRNDAIVPSAQAASVRNRPSERFGRPRVLGIGQASDLAGRELIQTRAQDSCVTRQSRALCYIPDNVDSRLSTATLMRRFYINLRSTSYTPFLNSSPWLTHLRFATLRCSRFRPTHPPSLSVGAARARLRASLPRRARLAPLRSPPRQSPMSTAVLRERDGCWDPAPEQDCRDPDTSARLVCHAAIQGAVLYPRLCSSRLSAATLLWRFYINLRSTSSTPFLNSSP